MAQVCLEGISKSYDRTPVIRELNLTVADHEFVVLVGPSGCGKSTVLRMIAGLEGVTQGTIRIGDQIVNEVPPKDRDIAMVFQSYALYPHMTVYDNMAFGLKMRKTPKATIRQRVTDAARTLDLTSLLDRKPRQLSGGQRQRVALGRAIVRNPQVFLMDEPLSNLDAKLRVHMRTEILKLHRRLCATTLYVTHDQVEAMTMGDRLVILNEGVIQQVGAPAIVYVQPANRFVGSFMGHMDFITLPCTQGHIHWHNQDEQTSWPIPPDVGQALAIQSPPVSEVLMGIRPEHLVLIEPPSSGHPTPTLTVTPEIVEVLGHETRLHVTWNHTPLVAALPADAPVREGQAVELSLQLDKVSWFHPVSGLNLQARG
jgi:multiple sugar transport system ATP-binding protein